ncbi:GerMN domain-containing protein [Solwaraspora sp. WMMD1047]|uniref:GerMN domain-containing protein n=1 Tax=Solwaraspora sp. WMMD1047 TaxID=3016102 RepID=UPI002416A597|nr:GerMN domain-containing protein [Solwaraspora sp. WMMD1047]MDG4830442.1 GerMN domain-containing protein [Solwaraspora sp. WMMD1047]
MTGSDQLDADEERLRRALRAAADQIEVRPDALSAIQDRILAERSTGLRGLARAWWPGRTTGARGRVGAFWRRSVPAAAGAVTLATAVTIGMAVIPEPAPAPAPIGGQERYTPGPSPVGIAAVAVYYLGDPPGSGEVPGGFDDPDGDLGGRPDGSGEPVGEVGEVARPRLYREFHRLDVGDASAAAWVAAAVRRMLDPRGPDDPDYASGWPTGARLRDARVSQGVATVDLSGAGTNGVPAATARQAVQQLVWTVTAVAGVDGVRIQLDGVAVDRLWGAVDVRGVQRRGPAVDALAPVWLVAPQHGVFVGRNVAVHVAGIVAGAIVHLRVRQDSRIVEERALNLSAGHPAQGEARVTLRLPPGEYLLQAYTISAADGAERYIDDHRIEVR